MYVYHISVLGGVNRRIIALLFCIIESPDGFNRAIVSIAKLRVVTDPNRKNITLMRHDLIGVSFGWFMGKFKHHGSDDHGHIPRIATILLLRSCRKHKGCQ